MKRLVVLIILLAIVMTESGCTHSSYNKSKDYSDVDLEQFYGAPGEDEINQKLMDERFESLNERVESEREIERMNRPH